MTTESKSLTRAAETAHQLAKANPTPDHSFLTGKLGSTHSGRTAVAENRHPEDSSVTVQDPAEDPTIDAKAVARTDANPVESNPVAVKDITAPEARLQAPQNKPLQPIVIKDAIFNNTVLFSTTEKESYAVVNDNGRVVTALTDSLEFRLMLVRALMGNTEDAKGVPSKQELDLLVHQYRYLSLLSPNQFPVFNRCAMFGDAVYIDLGDATGERIKITADGWEIEPSNFNLPYLLRPAGMLPLPRPERGGSIKQLARFLNLQNRTEDDFKLLVGWLVDALYPGGPYMMLVLNGPQGSSKSTTLRILRDLIDPAEAAMPSLPRHERDLFISGSKLYLMSYDNVSKLKDALSDAFCRVINNGTFRTRRLRTNTEEVIIKLRRPVIFNGISHFVSQNDFMDRAIFIELPAIDTAQRRTEGDLEAEWAQARPKILGALYDLVAVALHNLKTVKLPKLPRMADSARWITAAESEGLWDEGSFLESYQDNRSGIIDLTLESDPVAVGILSLLRERKFWTGTNTNLLEELRQIVPKNMRKLNTFPKVPNALSNRVMRLEGFLATRGIKITRERKPQKRLITLSCAIPTNNIALNADAPEEGKCAEDQFDDYAPAEEAASLEMEYGEV